MTKKLDDFSIYQKNPFFKRVHDSNIIQGKDKKYSLPTSLVIRDNDGKSLGSAFIRKNERNYIDTRHFIRIPVEALYLLSQLQQTELKILSYILLFIEQNNLEIVLQIEKIKKFYGYTSRNPIYKGITGLLEKEIIARKEGKKPTYFINPMFCYKGTIIKEFFQYLIQNNLKKDSSTNLYKDKQFDPYTGSIAI